MFPLQKPRVFKRRYFYNDPSFSRSPFQKSFRPQTPPEVSEIVNKNPWTSARLDGQKNSEVVFTKLGESSNSEEEEDTGTICYDGDVATASLFYFFGFMH